ncbi:MAG: hydrolase [Alkaliphilus sp.]|nr:MBL fold metallo-hydrolase [bacterium AH-315-E09]PHS31577.1 MAG: hydrolase [Alkaliphilus sp.]
MKITTLIEDLTGDNKKLKCEHGLSFLIEVDKEKILFDTGETGKFIWNAENLNIDLKRVNKVILSHAHHDHCNGVRKILKHYDIAPKFYVGSHFFKNGNKYRYSEEEMAHKYVGADFDEEFLRNRRIEIEYVNENITKISEDVYIFANFDRSIDFEKNNHSLRVKRGNEYEIDKFEDEIVVGLDTKKGLLLLLGCSHPGIINIIETIAKRTSKRIYGIVGGTHLIEADEDRIKKTMEYLKKVDTKILGFSHCTGVTAEKMFKEEFMQFYVNRTGSVIEI